MHGCTNGEIIKNNSPFKSFGMNVLELFKKITTFVFDLDGVLTDGSLFIFPGNNWVRRMNIKDGYALQLAVKKGYRVMIISGSVTSEVKDRLNKLGVEDVFMGVEDKRKCLEDYTQQHHLSAEEVLFMGDDIPDCEVATKAGMSACPADAVPEIKAICHYISPIKGGEGCVRDVIEKTMKLRGDWLVDTSVRAR